MRNVFTSILPDQMTLAFFLAFAVSSGSSPAQTAHCTPHTEAMSAGDVALARGEYDKAIAIYTSRAISGAPGADQAHNALIRTLLDANRTSEAESDATAWTTRALSNAWAKTSLAEVRYREGSIPAAYQLLTSALTLDSCNSQVHADLASIYELSAMFATADRSLAEAHALNPVDDAITRRWIFSHPAAQQLDEITAYLDHSTFLADAQRADLMLRQRRLRLELEDPCRLKTPVGITTIPFYAIQNGPHATIYWGIIVNINGKTLRLGFNTLISGILLTKSAADRLQLQPEAGLVVDGLGSLSDRSADVAKVDSIGVGPLGFEHCDVLFAHNDFRVDSERHPILFVEPGSDGFIGPDALRDFLVSMDFPGHELRLDPLPTPVETPALTTGVAPSHEPTHDRIVDLSMKTWTTIFRIDQFLIMPSQIEHGPAALYGIATSSILDSMSLDIARRTLNVSSNSREMPTLGGKTGSYYETSGLTLDFAGYRWPFSHMSALDNTPWDEHHGLNITGFLGKPILRNFTLHIDYRDNLLRIDFDPKRVPQCDKSLPACA